VELCPRRVLAAKMAWHRLLLDRTSRPNNTPLTMPFPEAAEGLAAAVMITRL
jgi:hypothetical protein